MSYEEGNFDRLSLVEDAFDTGGATSNRSTDSFNLSELSCF